jgi:hypothetical protein
MKILVCVYIWRKCLFTSDVDGNKDEAKESVHETGRGAVFVPKDPRSKDLESRRKSCP